MMHPIKRIRVDREEIEDFIKERSELGYVDTEDFIRDALRHFLFHRVHTASIEPSPHP